jgi:hypothetical protein
MAAFAAVLAGRFELYPIMHDLVSSVTGPAPERTKSINWVLHSIVSDP